MDVNYNIKNNNFRELNTLSLDEIKPLYGFILHTSKNKSQAQWVIDQIKVKYKKKLFFKKQTGSISAESVIIISDSNKYKNVDSETQLNNISKELAKQENPLITDNEFEAKRYVRLLNTMFHSISDINSDFETTIEYRPLIDILTMLDPNILNYLDSKKPQSL